MRARKNLLVLSLVTEQGEVLLAMLDLYRTLQESVELTSRLESLVGELETAERAGNKTIAASRMQQIISVCDGNFSLLTPFFFPRFTRDSSGEKWVPLSLLSRPFLLDLMRLAPGESLVIRGSRQLGKTVAIVARARMTQQLMPGHRTMYIAPMTEHIKTFAQKYREMERSFRYPVVDRTLKQNLYFKEYPGNGSLQILRILTSAGDARGKTVDDLIFDEFQDFDAGLLGDVEQVQRASKFRTTIYSGTSKTIDTALEVAFQDSSQGFYFVRSGDGKTYLNCGDPETVVAMVQKDGPTCPITGKILNMLDGFFEHAYPSRIKDGRKGLHIPQIIVNDFVHDPLEWQFIYDTLRKRGVNKLLQEVMGIPIVEGLREITLQHLQSICVLGDPAELRKRAKAGFYRFIASGVDWGGSDYNPAARTKLSYTAHCIIGQPTEGPPHILFMRKHAGVDYPTIAGMIAKDHRDYCATAMASDFGGGELYRYIMGQQGQINPARHLVFQYQGPEQPMVSKLNTALLNTFGLNRTESITRLFSSVRDYPQDLLCYDWDKASDDLKDFLNLYRIPSDSIGGKDFFTYRRHGAFPDDMLHATNFAYTLIRLMRGEPMARDPMVQRMLIDAAGTGAPIISPIPGMIRGARPMSG